MTRIREEEEARMTTTNRREQNLFVHSGKSEEEVTNDRRLHSIYCTVEGDYLCKCQRGYLTL